MLKSITRFPTLATFARQTRLASTTATESNVNEKDGQRDGSPTGYTVPAKESMTDEKLPESQNEHPGPVHEEGEEKKGK